MASDINTMASNTHMMANNNNNRTTQELRFNDIFWRVVNDKKLKRKVPTTQFTPGNPHSFTRGRVAGGNPRNPNRWKLLIGRALEWEITHKTRLIRNYYPELGAVPVRRGSQLLEYAELPQGPILVRPLSRIRIRGAATKARYTRIRRIKIFPTLNRPIAVHRTGSRLKRLMDKRMKFREFFGIIKGLLINLQEQEPAAFSRYLSVILLDLQSIPTKGMRITNKKLRKQYATIRSLWYSPKRVHPSHFSRYSDVMIAELKRDLEAHSEDEESSDSSSSASDSSSLASDPSSSEWTPSSDLEEMPLLRRKARKEAASDSEAQSQAPEEVPSDPEASEEVPSNSEAQAQAPEEVPSDPEASEEVPSSPEAQEEEDVPSDPEASEEVPEETTDHLPRMWGFWQGRGHPKRALKRLRRS